MCNHAYKKNREMKIGIITDKQGRECHHSIYYLNGLTKCEEITEIYCNNTLADVYIQQNLGSSIFIARGILAKLPEEERSYEKIEDLARNTEKLSSLPSVINNPLIQQLKMEHAEVEAKYANFSKRYKKKHPTMIELTSTLKRMEDRINQETKRVVESIKTELLNNETFNISESINATEEIIIDEILELQDLIENSSLKVLFEDVYINSSFDGSITINSLSLNNTVFVKVWPIH